MAAATKLSEMTGVREYCEEGPVEVWIAENNEVVVRAYNEAGYRQTDVDLLDLIEWIFGRGVSASMTRDEIRSALLDRTPPVASEQNEPPHK